MLESRRSRVLVLAYLGLVHALLLVLLLWPGALGRLRDSLLGPRPQPDVFYETMRFTHDRMDGNVRAGSLLFFGDSILESVLVGEIAPHAVNFGISGDTSGRMLDRFVHNEAVAKAGGIVFAIGVNDLIWGVTPERLAANVARLLDAVPPGTPAFVTSILPVREEAHPAMRGLNAKIRDANARLRALAASRQAGFVDLAPSLADEGGSLGRDLHVGDGLHLNERGNEAWIRGMREALAGQAPALLRGKTDESPRRSAAGVPVVSGRHEP